VLAVISQPEFKNQDFIFLTLTMKNVPAEGLDAALDTLLGGFNSLTSNVRQPFRVSFTGLFRAVEVTYNRGNGTYHPHLHVLASVSEGYFKKSNAHYMSREKLQRLWQKAVDADYKPMVGIQRVRGADYKPIAEVAKYTVKTAAIHSPEVLRTFDRSLHKRRLIAYVGLFKDVKRRLKLRDEEDENAGSEKTKEILCNPFIVKELYKWNFGTKTYRLVEEA
jgi:plasmid rolling circle replication initiator protein Rep